MCSGASADCLRCPSSHCNVTGGPSRVWWRHKGCIWLSVNLKKDALFNPATVLDRLGEPSNFRLHLIRQVACSLDPNPVRRINAIYTAVEHGTDESIHINAVPIRSLQYGKYGFIEIQRRIPFTRIEREGAH